MFSPQQLTSLDRNYFDVILADPYDVTLRSKNTGHYVVIDQELPVSDRVASYIRQIGNPYCYKSHGVVVKINFAGERHLEDCIQNCMNV